MEDTATLSIILGLVTAGVLTYLVNDFASTTFVKPSCRAQITLASIIGMSLVAAYLAEVAVRMSIGLVRDSPLHIAIALVIIVILVLLILQKSLPLYRRLRLYTALYNARAAARGIQNAEALDHPAGVREFTGNLQDHINEANDRLKDLPNLDPNDFSAEERDVIKQLLTAFDDTLRDPDVAQDVKDLVSDLSDKLKAFR